MFNPIAIFVSDLHAGLKLPHANVNADATSSDRLDDVIDIISQVRDYAVENSVKHVFILGDLFDQRHPDAPTLIRTARALLDLAATPAKTKTKRRARAFRPPSTSPRRVYILPGNHDAHDRAGKVYSVDQYEALQTPGIEVLGTGWHREIEGVGFSAIPWVPDKLFRARVKDAAEKLPPAEKNVLLFHQSVQGSRDGSHVAEGVIAPAAFDAFDLALSGHIHQPQRLGVVQYLGAPLHLRFTDAGQPRGFWAMDKDCELQFIETHFPRFRRWRFIEDEDVSPFEIAEAMLPELVDELSEAGGMTYLEVTIEGERAPADDTAAMVREALDGPLKPLLRRARVNIIHTDRGASERVRAAATTPGGVATPSDLVRAYIKANTHKLPSGVAESELIAYGEGVLR